MSTNQGIERNKYKKQTRSSNNDMKNRFDKILDSNPCMRYRKEVPTHIMDIFCKRPGELLSEKEINFMTMIHNDLNVKNFLKILHQYLKRYSTEGSTEKLLSECLEADSSGIESLKYSLDPKGLTMLNYAYARYQIDLCFCEIYEKKDLTYAVNPTLMKCLMHHHELFKDFYFERLLCIFNCDEELFSCFTKYVVVKAKENPEITKLSFEFLDKLCDLNSKICASYHNIFTKLWKDHYEAKLHLLQYL